MPKGFFPVQDTGLIQGISEARRPFPTPPWRSASRRWPPPILKDPDVVSLSSFIGVDGTNTTLNSGRFLINLKPQDDRSDERDARSSAACSARRRTSPASRSTCSRCRT